MAKTSTHCTRCGYAGSEPDQRLAALADAQFTPSTQALGEAAALLHEGAANQAARVANTDHHSWHFRESSERLRRVADWISSIQLSQKPNPARCSKCGRKYSELYKGELRATADRLVQLHGLADKWRTMASDEDDPAVAMARKTCAEDLRALLGQGG